MNATAEIVKHTCHCPVRDCKAVTIFEFTPEQEVVFKAYLATSVRAMNERAIKEHQDGKHNGR